MSATSDDSYSPSAEYLILGLVREALIAARDSSHVCGLARGLEIAISALCNRKDPTQETASILGERMAVLSKTGDTYHNGIAAGIRLSINIVNELENRTPRPLRIALFRVHLPMKTDSVILAGRRLLSRPANLCWRFDR